MGARKAALSAQGGRLPRPLRHLRAVRAPVPGPAAPPLRAGAAGDLQGPPEGLVAPTETRQPADTSLECGAGDSTV